VIPFPVHKSRKEKGRTDSSHFVEETMAKNFQVEIGRWKFQASPSKSEILSQKQDRYGGTHL
jgi:hypothetical protein